MTVSVRTNGTKGQLAAALRRRDPVAWEQLVGDQHARMFNVMLRLTGDHEVAADLTQETFVAAYTSAHTFKGRSQPQAWLYGVALNCHRNWLRQAGRHEPPEELEDDLSDPKPTVEELAQLREQSALIYAAVRRLPDVYRRTVALRYFAGVPAVEIASEEGVDAGTVRWRLHRALQKLWVMLAPEIGKEERE